MSVVIIVVIVMIIILTLVMHFSRTHRALYVSYDAALL